VRRLLSRSLAIIPALFVLAWYGDRGVTPLLIGSQVLLSLQLPFAIVPLIKLTSARGIMGEHASSRGVRVASGACAILIVAANASLLESSIADLRASAPALSWVLTVASIGALGLLLALCAVKLRCERETPPPATKVVRDQPASCG
jgi:manganese transport protein